MRATHEAFGDATFAQALGQQLRRLRESLVPKMSQEKVARRMDSSRETVRRIEQGVGTTTATIDEYLDAIGRTWADVLRSDLPDGDGIGWLCLSPAGQHDRLRAAA